MLRKLLSRTVPSVARSQLVRHCTVTSPPTLRTAACVGAATATAAAAFAVNSAVLCDGATHAEGGKEMKKLVKTLTMHKSSSEEGKLKTEELEAMLRRLEKIGDGKITLEQWQEHLAKSGLSKPKRDELEALFRELDKDQDGAISIDEFAEQFHPDYAARYARSGMIALRGAVKTFLTKGRIIAYTSDIGESARPVMPSWFVNACYGLTFLYVGVAVGHHTHEAYESGASQNMVLRAFTHTATFELLASVAMPSLIIHQAVHFAQHHAHRLPKGPIATWAPTFVGLCCIPFLPYLDPPAEKAIDAAFDYAWPAEAGHGHGHGADKEDCLLYTSPSPRDRQKSRMPSSA